MDDKEKPLFDSVADTIKRTFDIATEAASKALEPQPTKTDEKLTVVPYPPAANVTDPASDDVAIVKKERRRKTGVDTSGRITPAYDIPLPDTPMPSSKKITKKASRKPARKAAKESVQKAVKKVAKKSSKAGKKSTLKKPRGPRKRRGRRVVDEIIVYTQAANYRSA